MKKRFKEIWEKLSLVGVYSSLSSRDKRITRLINQFSLCILSLMFFSFIYQSIKHLVLSGKIMPHSYLMLLTFSPYALVFVFNHFKKYGTARFVIILHSLLINLFWTFTNIGQEANIYGANIILAIPIMIFFRAVRTQIALILLTYLFYILSYYIDQNYSAYVINNYLNPSFNVVVFGIWILLSFLMLRFFIIEIDNAEAKLESKNTELEDFARLASHDMKEPLRTISSFSSLLRKKHATELSEQASGYLNYIETGSKRLNDLLDDLSHYSRLNINHIELTEVDLNKVLKNVLMDLTARIEDSNAQIFHEELPTILAHESHMTLLFSNLITNGLKFQPKELDNKPEIRIAAKSFNGQHTISFKDNGIGIKEENISKIFKKFKKIHGKKEYEGTGLGLATCQRISELYQGSIFVTSKLGMGSIFKVVLSEK